MASRLVLATTSRYRIEAFQKTGLEFTHHASNVDERYEGRPSTPGELTLALATRKAEAVSKLFPDDIVIGLDSVCYCEGRIWEKPKTKKEALERLLILGDTGERNVWHELWTGVAYRAPDPLEPSGRWAISRIVTTRIMLRPLTLHDIRRYLDKEDDWRELALGYNPLKGRSMTFPSRIEGDHNNFLYGIPIAQVITDLRDLTDRF
jgi:septum formation protein